MTSLSSWNDLTRDGKQRHLTGLLNSIYSIESIGSNISRTINVLCDSSIDISIGDFNNYSNHRSAIDHLYYRITEFERQNGIRRRSLTYYIDGFDDGIDRVRIGPDYSTLWYMMSLYYERIRAWSDLDTEYSMYIYDKACDVVSLYYMSECDMSIGVHIKYKLDTTIPSIMVYVPIHGFRRLLSSVIMIEKIISDALRIRQHMHECLYCDKYISLDRPMKYPSIQLNGQSGKVSDLHTFPDVCYDCSIDRTHDVHYDVECMICMNVANRFICTYQTVCCTDKYICIRCLKQLRLLGSTCPFCRQNLKICNYNKCQLPNLY